MRKIIFRVEGYDGLGIYNSKKEIDKYIPGMCYRHSKSRLHPTIQEDFRHIDETDKTACPNACAFFHWFGEDLPEIIKHYKIYAISIKTYEIGWSKNQVLYSPKNVMKKTRIFK